MKNNENWPSGWWIFPGLLLSLLLILVTCSGCAHDPWSKPDIAREALYIGVSVVDMGQTLDIKNHPELRETNPLLGDHPSDGRIKTFFVTTRVLHIMAVHWMPAEWRATFQGIGIGYQFATVVSNNRLGLSVNF